MITVQIEDWRVYRRDGIQFLNTAVNAYRKGRKAFSAETLYNLTCMSIEKTVMAFLMSRGDLAENHTMRDLYAALASHLGHDDELSQRFAYLDSFQEICDQDTMIMRHPGNDDIDMILGIGSEVQLVLDPFLN